MKPYIYLIILSIGLFACAKPISIPYERTAAVEFVSGDKNTLTVNSYGVAENLGKAIYHAELNAIENILFRGIPNSNQENPMIQNESLASAKFKTQLDNLIYKEGYKKYLIESYIGQNDKSSKSVNVRQIIKFDINSLRKYLEELGLTRKFGL